MERLDPAMNEKWRLIMLHTQNTYGKSSTEGYYPFITMLTIRLTIHYDVQRSFGFSTAKGRFKRFGEIQSCKLRLWCILSILSGLAHTFLPFGKRKEGIINLEYVRASMLGREEDFDLFLMRLELFMGMEMDMLISDLKVHVCASKLYRL